MSDDTRAGSSAEGSSEESWENQRIGGVLCVVSAVVTLATITAPFNYPAEMELRPSRGRKTMTLPKTIDAGLAPIAALYAKGPRSTTPPDDNMIESKKLVITMYEWEVAILRDNVNAYALWCALQSWFGHVPEPMTLSPSALVEADMNHGWGKKRYRRALKWLVDAHMLKVLNQGGGKGNGFMTFSPSALVEADMIHGWDEQRYRRALIWLVDAHMLKVLNQGGDRGNRWVYCFDKPSEEAIERAVDQFRHARRRKEIPRSDGRGLMQLHPGEAA